MASTQSPSRAETGLAPCPFYKTDLTWHGFSQSENSATIWQDNEIESVVCGLGIDRKSALAIVDHHNKALEEANRRVQGSEDALVDCQSRLSRRVEQVNWAANLIRLLVSSSQGGVRDHDLEISGVQFAESVALISAQTTQSTATVREPKSESAAPTAPQEQPKESELKAAIERLRNRAECDLNAEDGFSQTVRQAYDILLVCNAASLRDRGE